MKSPAGQIGQTFINGGQRIPDRRLSPKALKGFRLFFYLGCVTSIVLVVVVGMVSYQTLNRQQVLEKWVEHTYKVLRKTDAITMCFNQTLLLDGNGNLPDQADSGSFGIRQYEHFKQQVHGLMTLVKDNQLRFKEISLLKSQIDDLFQARGDLKQFRAQIGKINGTFQRIKQREELLLLRRENAYNRSGRQTQIVIVVGSVLILLIVSFLIYVILTELKNRIRAYQEEHELNELKSSFITLASHEFRTPLSSILLSANLIERYLERDEKEPIEKHVTKIKQVVHNLEDILEDFLSLDQLEEGLVKAEFTSFDLVKLCQYITSNFSLNTKPGQRLVYDLPGAPQVVKLDRELIEKSLGCLISNAIKYAGDEARIWLTTAVNANMIVISVKDNGAGIAEADQQKLSSLFYRVNKTGHIAGTGLGLNIVQRYVQLMNGTLQFSSVPDEETSFTMTFPKGDL